MRKVGIMGGTFNPIHNGHLLLAKAAKDQYALDEIWLMPSKIPPHKSRFSILSEKDRLAMAALAAKEYEGFGVSDFECQKEGITYSADTFDELSRVYPDITFYFIIGGDSLIHFAEWKWPRLILEKTILLAGTRYGIDDVEAKNAIDNLCELFPFAKIYPVKMPDINISSSLIRKAFYEGRPESVSKMMPLSVYEYLSCNSLYQKASFLELDSEMRRILPEKRYLHSVAVAHLSAALAASLGLDTEVALTAGILHDCAKAMKDEALVKECERVGIAFSETEKKNGFLLHGKLGAYYAKNKYYISDERVLSAIFWHTTGKPNMSQYEQIVFLADYLEPFRTQPTNPPLSKLRCLAFHDINAATRLVLENTLRYLSSLNGEIEEHTQLAFDYYNSL